MDTVIEYFLKSAGILAIFVVTYNFLLRRLTFFNANRWFLLAGILISIIAPLVEITQTVYVPQAEQIVAIPQQVVYPATFAVIGAVPNDIAPFDYSLLAQYIYVAISLFFIGKMFVELISLRSLINSGKKLKSGKFVMVTLSRKLTPFSFFNYICYNREDEHTPGLAVILEHEKVHVRQWHSIDLLISHLYRAVFWINPLAWILKKQIGENLEFIADCTAKLKNKTCISYERTLLSTAASHMQPALANNFFTPFLKKRILMLQKEASARWNAYKYALILPVLVLFLYSFNVVEKVEYVKENNFTNATVDQQKATDSLFFDIIPTTSDARLELYKKEIEENLDYQIRFDDIKRDRGQFLKEISFSVKFLGKDWEKGLTVTMEPNELITLTAYDDKITVQTPKNGNFITIDKSGTSIQVRDLVLGSFNAARAAAQSISQDNFNGLIAFKVKATSTEQYLAEKKAYLKDKYNVDFSYSGLKIKDGRIVKIKLTLNDHSSRSIETNVKSTDGIESICITGIFDKNKRVWDMNACNETKIAKQTLNGVALKLDSIPQSNLQLVDLKLENLKLDFKENNIDSIVNIISLKIKNLNLDSLQKAIKLQLKDLKRDSMAISNATFSFKDKQTEHSFENGISTRVTTKMELNNLKFDNNQPLIFLDGKEISASQLKAVDGSSIKSLNLLSKEDGLQLYGEKGKRGVLLATTIQGYKNGQKELKDSIQNESTITNAISQKLEVAMIKLLKENKGHGHAAVGDHHSFYISDISKDNFDKFQKYLEDAGHTFKLLTHRMNNDKLVKLKYVLNGSQYLFENNNGMKLLMIEFATNTVSPVTTMIPFE
jgi:hypothetical protein